MDAISIAGASYVAVGAIHLVIFAVKKVRRRNFSNPMEALVVAFVWPAIDIMLILGFGERDPRNQTRNKSYEDG